MLLDYIKIPHVFTFYSAYAHDYIDNQNRKVAHYCTECGWEFSVTWPVRSNMGWEYTDDKLVYCPGCGKAYIRKTYKGHNLNIKVIDMGDIVPLDMTLKLEKFKYGLRLTIKGKEMSVKNMSADHELWMKDRYVETITFNLHKRKTIFKRVYGLTNLEPLEIEIGNPYDETFCKESHLSSLYYHPSLKPYKEKITNMLHILRREVCRWLTKTTGHKIKHMYKSYGTENSLLLIPIMNIAYRIICLDAPNLSDAVLYSDFYRQYNTQRTRAQIYYPDEKYLTNDRLDFIRKEKDTVSAFIKLAGLPDKRIFRRILTAEPFDFILLSKIYTTFDKNIDNTIAVYKYCTTTSTATCSNEIIYPNIEETIKDAHKISQYYSGSEVMKLFKHTHNGNEFHDTAYMLGMMNKKIKDKFYKSNPSILTVHDWLASENWKAKHESIDFNIKTPLYKRLIMQIDNMEFFAPKTSLELYMAGKTFHNCVGTYKDRVINDESQIIFAADDKGKLTICIEVCDNRIVQAKLFANKLVSSNYVLNTAVIDWAEKAKVNWQSCRDIQPKAKQIAAIAV
ncbi:PcfJ domain-containing protein [Pectinatus frisingensis]|uniref:PcfJ domain-containing protein n=1 Tax=Pectinatus frisingensis TaxID=865 RepID=UPI0018C6CEB5|nr:PcfJ domain-containing protein [Pectinatus frisingensis]